jgi:hypothetical protein
MKCPGGGAFVRLVNGRWNEVGEHVAREKVGYVFRELLHEKYRSSTKSKMARRRHEEQVQRCTPEGRKPSTTFFSARKSVDMPMKENSIFPSMLPMDIMQTFTESRAFSRSIDKVLQDGFKVIAEAEKALGYGQEFYQNVVADPRVGEKVTKKRDFLQEARAILLSELNIGTEDLVSDLDISHVFDFNDRLIETGLQD